MNFRFYIKQLLIIVILLFPIIESSADSLSPTFANMNFEKLDGNQQLTFWQIYGDQQVNVIDKENKLFGEQALFLSTVKSNNNSPQSFFGQTIYAEFDRKTITLTGYVKYQNYSLSGQFILYLTTYEGNEERGETKYIEHKLRNTQEWQKISITLPINKSVLYANIGGVLLGKGKVWVDQMQLDFSFPYQAEKQSPQSQFVKYLAIYPTLSSK